MEKTTNLYSLTLKEYKSYLFATLFVAGNIALPQLCHLIPNGGLIILPIYFFTLVAAYKFGWRVGIMCGIAHTDLFKYCDMYGFEYTEFFEKMAQNNMFWEMNVTYDSIHKYIT